MTCLICGLSDPEVKFIRYLRGSAWFAGWFHPHCHPIMVKK